MAGSEEEKTLFDMEAASALVKELRDTCASGKTRSYEWRVTQLKCLVKLCDENEKEIADALRQDLSKPEFESIVYEVTISPILHIYVDFCFLLLIYVLKFSFFF